MDQTAGKSAASPIPKGFHTLTPYPVVKDAAGFVEFLKTTFDAEETFRTVGSPGGLHCEARIGDSMIMIGGGGPELSWRGESRPMAFHIYVRDTDAAYRLSLQNGAVSLEEPADQPWGERRANVKDAFGNFWYLATSKGPTYYSEGAPTIQPYLHPLRGGPLIDFLVRAFEASETGRATSDEGAILHTTIKIGDSALEIGDADGPYQPMRSTFYLYVPDVDAVYRRALEAGATSISEPVNQSYGDRSAGVDDAFGNRWHIATHFRDAA